MTIDSGTRSSDAYTNAVCFFPNGSELVILLMKGRELPPDLARDGLLSGQMVWVAPADADKVRAWLRQHLAAQRAETYA